jgi:hypothetical protein
MISKVLAVAAFAILPLSIALWHKSHGSPEQYRWEVTHASSLRIYLREGVCSLRLLSLPDTRASRSDFRATLEYNPTPNRRSFLLTSVRQGAYRITWIVFPFWFSTVVLTIAGVTPIVRGPVRRQWRRWRGACVWCGYDLWGNRSGRCPECGMRFRKPTRASTRASRFQPRRLSATRSGR